MVTVSKVLMEIAEQVNNHSKCQTASARWLCIYELYEKLEHPGQYDIGGTYSGQQPDYWFKFSTSNFHNNLLLKLFVCNRNASPFTLGIGLDTLWKQTKLQKNKDGFKFEEQLEFLYFSGSKNTCNYIKSFLLTKNEAKRLQNKEVFIALKINTEKDVILSKEVLLTAKSSGKVGTLLFNHSYSNIILESSDGHKFPAHRAILISQSKKFKTLLEKEQSELKLPDVDEMCLSKMLTYMYTGKVPQILECDCVALLKAALQYSIDGLITLAQYAVEKQLNIKNVFELLKICQEYRNTRLLRQACFIIFENAETTLGSDEWKSFNDVNAIKTLTEYLFNNDIMMADGLETEKTEESNIEPENEEDPDELAENNVIY